LHLPKYPLQFVIWWFWGGMLHLRTEQLFHMKQWISNVFSLFGYIGCLLFACCWLDLIFWNMVSSHDCSSFKKNSEECFWICRFL
jgi:hypothetical protein